MSDPFVEKEWQELCGRLDRSAEYFGTRAAELADAFRQDADEFRRQDAPDRYPDLLDRFRSAAALAHSWRDKCHCEGDGQRAEQAVLEPESVSGGVVGT